MKKTLRGEKQTEALVFRCSPTDKASIQKVATERGTNVSALVKQLMIEARIIEPVNKTPNTQW